jgi:hypothetical protein
MSSPRVRAVWILTATCAALTLVLWLGGCKESGELDPGASAAQEFADDYAAALAANDAERLADLLHEPADSAAVRDRLARYGAPGLHNPQATTSSEFPRIYRVLIVGRTSASQPVRIRETIEWQDERWWMAPLPSAATTAPGG